MDGLPKAILLAFSPLFDEADFTAESHKEFIEQVLQNVFKKNLENVVCLVGDNCSTNHALATLCRKPLVGCAAHKFNLQIQAYLTANYDPLLSKVWIF
jgi:hypothetical protein